MSNAQPGETVPVLTKSLRRGDTVLAYQFGTDLRRRQRAVTSSPDAYVAWGGTLELVVDYTEPAVGRTKYDKAARDVRFTDGSWARSIASATWLRRVFPCDGTGE